MTAQTKDFLSNAFGTVAEGAEPVRRQPPLAAATTIFAGTMVAINTSGLAVPAAATRSLRIIGYADRTASNVAGVGPSNGTDTDVRVIVGAWYLNTPSSGVDRITSANIDQPCYVSYDNEVCLTDGGGTRPYAGLIKDAPGTGKLNAGKVAVRLGVADPYEAVDPGTMSTAFTARGVVTSIAAYTGTGTGILTGTANGALGAQDGLTYVAGQVIFLPAVTGGAGGATVAGDEGPYVVTTVGTASVKFVLTRPSWWAHGATIAQGVEVIMGGEGTIWQGATWRAMCGVGIVVGTGAALMYPRVHKGTGAVGTPVTALYAMPAAIATAVDATANASVKAVLVAGNGTGTLTFTGTGTDAISYTVVNF